MSLAVSEMTEITAGLPSKSEKIRRLHAAGCSRSEIADFLDVRYQFVRNVLVDAERREGKRSGATKTAPLTAKSSHTAKVCVGPGGNISLPTEIQQALSLKEGDTLVATLDGGELRLLTVPAAVRRAQAIVKKFVPENVSLVAELLEDRRREAESDDD
jgi:hypothetical protein